MRKRIAFIKLGSFSHINASVEALLRQNFAEFDVDVIDVDTLLGNQETKLRNAISIFRYYGADVLRGGRSFKQCRFRTPYMFTVIRRLIRKRLSRDLSNYVFSFQTQSLFDGGSPGLPHFVYTDHTHLAKLYYPAFDRSKLFSKAWIDLEASIYRNATRTFTMSSHVQRSLLEHYHCGSDRVSCVFAGSNANSLPATLNNNNYNNKHILFAGVDWDRKGGFELLQAFSLVRQQHPDAQLTIVGCSPKLSLQNCEVAGRVPLEQMADHYARASVFCLPTRLEPFGIVFIEAFQNRLPIVATNIGALPDIVEHGKNGYLVEPNNPIDLARALCDLLSDPEKCRRFGDHGYQTVRERYSWEATGRRLRQEIQAAIPLT